MPLHAASAVPSGPTAASLPAPVWKGDGPFPVTNTPSCASAPIGAVLRRAVRSGTPVLRKKQHTNAPPANRTAHPLTLNAHATGLLIAGFVGPLIPALGSTTLLLIAQGSAARMSLPNAAVLLCLLWVAIAFVAAPTAAVLLSAL